jgi:hypothetical protein
MGDGKSFGETCDLMIGALDGPDVGICIVSSTVGRIVGAAIGRCDKNWLDGTDENGPSLARIVGRDSGFGTGGTVGLSIVFLIGILLELLSGSTDGTANNSSSAMLDSGDGSAL